MCPLSSSCRATYPPGLMMFFVVVTSGLRLPLSSIITLVSNPSPEEIKTMALSHEDQVATATTLLVAGLDPCEPCLPNCQIRFEAKCSRRFYVTQFSGASSIHHDEIASLRVFDKATPLPGFIGAQSRIRLLDLDELPTRTSLACQYPCSFLSGLASDSARLSRQGWISATEQLRAK